MSTKHFDPFYLYELPSGQMVHPSRLIHRDGFVMWKHALQGATRVNLPETEYIEHKIIHTAKRLEELNTWVAPTAQPWEGFNIHSWYDPHTDACDGNVVYFNHHSYSSELLYEELKKHIQQGEALSTSLASPFLKFQTA